MGLRLTEKQQVCDILASLGTEAFETEVEVFRPNIIETDPVTQEFGRQIINNGYLNDLRVYYEIKSLSEAPLPIFELTDSETAKLNKSLDVKWNSPRWHLGCYVKSKAGISYKIGMASITKPAGYPFEVANVINLYTDSVAYRLSGDAAIVVKLESAGYPPPLPGDIITVFGSGTQVQLITTDSRDEITTVVTPQDIL